MTHRAGRPLCRAAHLPLRASRAPGGGASLRLVLVLSCLVLWGCGTEETPVVIGVSAGVGFVEAARMAVEVDLARHGPIPGFDTVIIREASNRSAPALEAARTLVETPGIVAVIGHANSAASLATSPIYNEARVVQLAPTSTASLYREDGRFSFRMVPGDEAQGPLIAAHLAEHLPPGGRVAIAYVNDDYGRSLRAATEDALQGETQLQVVLTLPHTEGDVDEPDLEHIVDAISAAAPDGIAWLGRDPILDELLDDLRQAVGDVPLVGGDGISGAAARPAGSLSSDWQGVHFVTLVDLEATPRLREFSREFMERTGERPSGTEVLTADAMHLLLAGIREGVRTGPRMEAWLRSLGRDRPPYDGISGPIRFTEVGDRPLDLVVVPFPSPEP